VVQMPCPISEWARRTVTVSSVPMRRKALGEGSGFFLEGAASASNRPGTKKAMTRPVPEAVRKSRREMAAMAMPLA
jgi:hypothetical protein